MNASNPHSDPFDAGGQVTHNVPNQHSTQDDFDIVFSGLGAIGDGYDQERIAALRRIQEQYEDLVTSAQGWKDRAKAAEVERDGLIEQLESSQAALRQAYEYMEQWDDLPQAMHVRDHIERVLSNPAREFINDEAETSEMSIPASSLNTSAVTPEAPGDSS